MAASFARAARSYHAHAGVQEAMADWLAAWLPPARSGRVLEVGAGPGVFTRRLLRWNGPVTATDAVPAMCAIGRAAFPHVEWQVMIAEAPLPGPWDWIVSSSMLQWAESPAKVFARWRSRLSPGGRVLAGLFVEESLPELRSLTGGAAPLAWRTAETWREELARGELRLLRDDIMRRVLSYPSAQSLLRTLHQVGAAPERRLNAGSMRRLLRDYEARFAHGDGVRATWTFYRFEAER